MGMSDPRISRLGPLLKARRHEKRMSLRDLSDLIGVSLNTLARVERGQIADLKNFQRIVDWLEEHIDSFLDESDATSTPEIIARHLRSDHRLTKEAAVSIAQLVEEMYHKLVDEQPQLAIQLRS